MDTKQIQHEMFAQEKALKSLAEVFDAISTDCRLEIIYLLIRIDELPSGEIARLTNCSPSQVSQSLAKMYRAGLLQKTRRWKEVSYSLDRSNSFVADLIRILTIPLHI